MQDDVFLTHLTDRLGALPGVEAVSLGGSRAAGTHRAGSDWDFAVYYRAGFSPQALRECGWPGEVSEIGGWGGGVFNGGAWLRVDGRQVDVHYRDLESIEHELAQAAVGHFRIEPLMFHLAGIPSYLVLAELAAHRVLSGRLPRPQYPLALRARAPGVWWDRAERTFSYAETNYAVHGRLTPCAGLTAQAAAQAAHAVLATRGEWITNEKMLLRRAGLREIDHFLAAAETTPDALQVMVSRSRALCARVLAEASPVRRGG